MFNVKQLTTLCYLCMLSVLLLPQITFKEVWLSFVCQDTGYCSSVTEYSRVSFCDGSFYDDSLWRPLSSWTEHSQLVAHHCRNSRVLSVLSALLALFQCARVSFLSVLVQFVCDFSTHDVHQKDRKEEKIKTVYITFFLDVFWTMAWAFFNKIKSDLTDIFFQLFV